MSSEPTKESLRDALNTWCRLMAFHRPRVLLFALTVLCMALSATFNALSLAAIVPFTDIVLSREGPPSMVVADEPGAGVEGSIASFRAKAEARFYGLIRGRDRLHTLLRFCLALVGLFLLKNLFWYAQSFLSVHIEQCAVRDIRNAIFKRYETLSLDFYQGVHSGVLVSRITNDADLSRGAVANGVMELIRHIFALIGALALVLIAGAKLFVWAILILTPSMLLINQLGQVLRRISRISQELMARLTSVVGETVRGIRIIKAFGIEEYQAQRFMRETGSYCATLIRMTRIGSLGTPLTEILAVSVAAVLIYISGRQIIAGEMRPGDFLLFLAAFLSMIQPIKAMHQLNVRFQHGIASGRRIFAVLDSVPTVRCAPAPQPVTGFRDAIRFERVSFGYEQETVVLRDIDLTIPRGEIVALVGPSGSGKSTLISLIPRFFDPTAGRVALDGTDLRELDLAMLRAQIGIVTQETVLFQDTVAGNIRMGRRDATDEEVIAAAQAANADEFIRNMPQGYETPIGERGLRLSGGERQRITIARAVLKNPPVLILDEATSALDSESERLVQGAIENLIADRTAIVIAHRLSTVRRADQIAVMKAGEIVERGHHDQLIAQRGLYHKLHELQFAAEDVR